MTEFLKKFNKYIAMLVGITMLVTALTMTMSGFNPKSVQALDGFSEDDKRIAADISNTTGIKIDEILMLKKEGKSWNKILELLKYEAASSSTEDRDKRDKLLTNDGLGEAYIQELKKEGFKDSEIMEAKLMAERVIFNLREITTGNSFDVEIPTAEMLADDKEEDTQVYRDIMQKINMEKAVYLLLKLKDEFGSIEKVMDEYLLTLQIDLDLMNYISDKSEFLKQKEDKTRGMDLRQTITLEKIESRILESIQRNSSRSLEGNVLDFNASVSPLQDKENSDIPQPPVPEIGDIRPVNPAEAILSEIKAINPVN